MESAGMEPALDDDEDRWWLTPTEVGERLGVSRRTASRMIEDGTLPSTLIGRRRVVRRDLVDAIVAGKVLL